MIGETIVCQFASSHRVGYVEVSLGSYVCQYAAKHSLIVEDPVQIGAPYTIG